MIYVPILSIFFFLLFLFPNKKINIPKVKDFFFLILILIYLFLILGELCFGGRWTPKLIKGLCNSSN